MVLPFLIYSTSSAFSLLIFIPLLVIIALLLTLSLLSSPS
jgi:hypothetical protein